MDANEQLAALTKEVTRLSVEQQYLAKDIAEMKPMLQKLVQTHDMGRGALTFVLKAGYAIMGALGLAKLVWDMIPHK